MFTGLLNEWNTTRTFVKLRTNVHEDEVKAADRRELEVVMFETKLLADAVSISAAVEQKAGVF